MTIDQAKQRFADTLRQIEKQWYWYGIVAYIRLLNDIAHEDWLKFKAEIQQDANGFVEMQDSKPA